jgi:hypothetical protein
MEALRLPCIRGQNMGRVVKRVALDFVWPLNQVWQGYKNEHYSESWDCPECEGSGSSPAMKELSDKWYGWSGTFRPEHRGSTPFEPEHSAIQALARRNIEQAPEYYGKGEFAVQREARRLAEHYNQGWCHHLNDDDVAALIEGGRLWDFTRVFVPGEGWKDKEVPTVPSAKEVNEWSLTGFGHDSINQWVVCGAEAKRLGIETHCPHCKGEGTLWSSPEAEARAEAWERTEPPAGEGYQIWETVSDGSPISPVFATPEELARHMEGTRWGADEGTPYESWLAFIKGPGWAPSLVMSSQGIQEGVAAMAALEDHSSKE